MRYGLGSDSELTYPLPMFASLSATFRKTKAEKTFWMNFVNTPVCNGVFFVIFAKTLFIFESVRFMLTSVQ